MKSRLTNAFRAAFRTLPEHIKHSARRNYKLWKENPQHPGLQFKRVGNKQEAYSVRVGIGWRAIGVKTGDTIVWFWIGSHAEYDRLLQQF